MWGIFITPPFIIWGQLYLIINVVHLYISSYKFPLIFHFLSIWFSKVCPSCFISDVLLRAILNYSGCDTKSWSFKTENCEMDDHIWRSHLTHRDHHSRSSPHPSRKPPPHFLYISCPSLLPSNHTRTQVLMMRRLRLDHVAITADGHWSAPSGSPPVRPSGRGSLDAAANYPNHIRAQ